MTSSSSDLPTDWSSARLEDIVSNEGIFSDGDWVESKDQDPNGSVRLVQLADIGEMQFLDKSRRYMTGTQATALNCKFLQRGDLLISRLGDPLGKTCAYPAKEEKAVTVVDVCILRPAHDGIEPKLFGYFLNSGSLRHTINSQSSGTTRKRVTGKKLKALEVPVPPANEQRRIVEKIEMLFAQLDKGEEAIRQVQKLLKTYRQSVLKAAVTGELTRDWRETNKDKLEPTSALLARILKTRRENWQGRGKYKEPQAPDTSDLPELPEGWGWASVDQATELFSNGLSKKPVTHRTEYPILRISAVRPMLVTMNDLRFYEPREDEDVSKFWVEKDDLLFTRYNGSARYVGVCGLMRDSSQVLHPDKLIKARPVQGAGVDASYLETAWNCGECRRHIASNIKTTSGQQGIAGSDIKTAPFPLPSLIEQSEIAIRVREALGRVTTMEEWCETELKRSASLRQSVLKQAFSGKLVPQDPADEPASVLLERIKAGREAITPSRKKTSKKPVKKKVKA